jgi:signal peptidase I
MFDTLSNNDYIIVDKLSYYLSTPDFSDIIVFTPPSPRIRQTEGLYCLFTKISKLNFSKETCKMPDFFIKRIIGVPGDKIIIKNGDVYRNGKKLDESKYLTNNNNHHTYVKGTEEEEIFLVPENKYFVLGDNRQGSSDSRAHSQEWYNEQGEYDPFVKKSDIEGRYLFTLIPFSKVQAFISNLK